MKMFIDTKKTYGDLLFISLDELRDYKTKEPNGVVINAISLNTFDKLNVKIKGVKKEQFNGFKSKDLITFKDLMANYWSVGGKKGLSLFADDVIKTGKADENA